MKKINLFFLIMMILLSTSAAFAKIQVVTTLSDLDSIVRAVGKDRISSMYLARPNEDPHFVEPRPTFIRNLAKADMLFLIGMELEIWLQPLIESSQNLKIQKSGKGYVDCSNVIAAKEVPTTRVDPSLGDVHPYGNPHYWLSPDNAIKIAKLACDKLTEADPEGKNFYSANYENFKANLEAKINEWKNKLKGIDNKKIVCLHSSWIYFTDFASLEIIGYVESKPGIPPNAREITATVSLMEQNKCKTLVCETYQNKKFLNMIAKRIGGKVIVLPASVGAVKDTNDYISLIDNIVNTLIKEMK